MQEGKSPSVGLAGRLEKKEKSPLTREHGAWPDR